MLSDIEIINSSTMKEIRELTGRYGINDDELYAYGKYIAKAEFELLKRVENRPDGKLILVTAITPTPAGEGKSTITIGLVDVLNRLGKKVLGCIREPSLGPVFGVKGGAAGGGYAKVNPMVDLNLHFTGDIHAITTANNLVSACIDNHLYQGNELGIDPKRITWKRCLDLNDRALRKVTVGLDSKKEVPRPDYFNISVASEIMAILCLAHDYADLRERLDRTLIAYDFSGKPIAIKDLGITGSLMVLLKQALKPNFIQTLENNLMLVHGGPFANIAHGCNSVIASRLALKLADYVVTEAGFGADLGAEKFLDIKCQEEGLNPNLVVVVATIRALKYHGGVSVKNLNQENLEALKVGVKNLERHLQTVRTFELPAVVALNRFASDSEAEIEFMKEWAKANNVLLSLADVFSQGSQGGLELGKAVLSNLKDLKYKPIYKTEEDLFQKIEKICYKVYGASAVEYAPEALSELKRINQDEAYRNFYICMAKTPNSITDNPKIYGVPDNHTISIKEVRLSTGPKFVICLTGTIMTMPGLSKKPMATKITMTDDGTISGIM
jgi:formate--tetrahydrofolate ligase